MATKSKSILTENLTSILVTVVGALVLAMGGYIASGIQDNAYELRRVAEKQGELESSVLMIKKSVLKLTLSKDPKAADILGGLVVDTPTAKGIDLYKQGQVSLAISTWEDASHRGSQDAQLALQAAGIGGLDGIEVTGSRIRERSFLERLMFWKDDQNEEPE